jgi:mannose/fructose-specific phosphotransferase system component IIA
MIRCLVLTHGQVGSALVKVVELILGPVAGLTAESNEGRSAKEMTEVVRAWLGAAPGAGALILIDDYGGSCANAAQLAARTDLPAVILSGVNLAMLLSYATWRDDLDLEELAQRLIAKGREAIARVGKAK